MSPLSDNKHLKDLLDMTDCRWITFLFLQMSNPPLSSASLLSPPFFFLKEFCFYFIYFLLLKAVAYKFLFRSCSSHMWKYTWPVIKCVFVKSYFQKSSGDDVDYCYDQFLFFLRVFLFKSNWLRLSTFFVYPLPISIFCFLYLIFSFLVK